MSDSGIELRWSLPPSLPHVLADRHKLLQVFLNLTKNSTRAMESSDTKTFTIAASVEGDRVLVRVEDTGTGVAAPERLFQPFQPGAESTGLGLYVFARPGPRIPRRPVVCPTRDGLLFLQFR